MKSWKFVVRKNFPENSTVQITIDNDRRLKSVSIVDLPWDPVDAERARADQRQYDDLLSKYEGYQIEGPVQDSFNTSVDDSSEHMRLRVRFIRQVHWFVTKGEDVCLNVWDSNGKQIHKRSLSGR
jgi:hypothetical protein